MTDTARHAAPKPETSAGPAVIRRDVVVVGAGAAGLMTAIAARRRWPGLTVTVLDGAERLGRKILISGGGRCNVTNRTVEASDFNGGSRRFVARVLRAWTVPRTVEFFSDLGVVLHEEAHGKLFPHSHRAATVLEALLGEIRRCGADLRPGHRVARIGRDGDRFAIEGSAFRYVAARVVLATGGLSVPQTGSDGAGYGFARALGHTIVPTTPALVPLLLGAGFHDRVSGVSHPADLLVSAGGQLVATTTGALLWTHTGVSGPVVLDASRHWHRAELDGLAPSVHVRLRPGQTFDEIENDLLAALRARPRASTEAIVRDWLPASVAAHLLASAGIDRTTPLSQLARDSRRTLTHALTSWRLDVTGSRGYRVAEVTAGGVPLDEADAATMESKRCPGLYLVGEILDVDGRIGGFNFQWAWATGAIAGRAVGAG